MSKTTKESSINCATCHNKTLVDTFLESGKVMDEWPTRWSVYSGIVGGTLNRNVLEKREFKRM